MTWNKFNADVWPYLNNYHFNMIIYEYWTIKNIFISFKTWNWIGNSAMIAEHLNPQQKYYNCNVKLASQNILCRLSWINETLSNPSTWIHPKNVTSNLANVFISTVLIWDRRLTCKATIKTMGWLFEINFLFLTLVLITG